MLHPPGAALLECRASNKWLDLRRIYLNGTLVEHGEYQGTNHVKCIEDKANWMV